MVDLRDYQRDLLARAERGLASPKARVMVQLPTGGGKTRIAAALLAEWIKRGGNAVWLTHRRELSDQTCCVLNESGVDARNTLQWDADAPAPAVRGGVVILMIQTVSRRNHEDYEDLCLTEGVWEEYGPNDLLIIDEAHHATAPGWERAIRQWPGRVVGLTATPWRLKPNEGFSHLFDDLIPGPQIRKLQADRYLCKAQVLMPRQEDIIKVGITPLNRDYKESEIEQANSDRVMTASAFDFWEKHASERQTIIYAISKDHARNLSAVFKANGVSAAVMLGDTQSEERAKVMESFIKGTLQVLVNVAVATEGFDVPDASCVVLTRPTMSLALYLQMVGRGLRGKADGGNCLILDLAGNAYRHGWPEDDQDWSLEPRGQQGEGGRAPVVRCPECEWVSHASSHACQSCEAPFGKDCPRCGVWRAWKQWTAETSCGDAHDLVCNRCHPDAHELANLSLGEGLKEMLKGELVQGQADIKLSSLHTLEDVQGRLCEVAEALVYAKKIDDMRTFNHMTEQLMPLLRKETRLRKARDAEVLAEFAARFEAEHGPAIISATKQWEEKNLALLGRGVKMTHVFIEFDSEKGTRITIYWKQGDEIGEDVLDWMK